MMKKLLLFLLWGPVLYCKAIAQQSDNEDGTYTNPVIWSDFPDNDVIRVGDTYYMVATSMYFFPGVPILASKDLVNWSYTANAIQRFDQHPAYNMNGGTRYSHGQWASSLRYHNGKFYVLFVTLDEGGFLCTATHAEGPWTLQKLPKSFYDAGLFFDDDGRNYVVHGYSKLSLTEVDKNIAPVSKDSVIFDKVQRKGLEGSHVYKINGFYYIYATYGGGDGYQTCLRSKNIYGPYEEKIVLKDDMNMAGKGVHQGALVETPAGEWWSIIFQDRDGVGRVPTLQPVHWIDGWPMVGENGRAVVTYRKPVTQKMSPVKPLPTSDEFNDKTPGMQWAWNHNPNDSCWSLTERNGFLRLKTANVANDWLHARNTLTQRIFGPWSSAITTFDLRHMKAGDIAGLGVLQLPYAFIAIKAGDEGKSIVMVNNGKTKDSIALTQTDTVFFKAYADIIKDETTFYYSVDNLTFMPFGDTLHMRFDLKMFTGSRLAVFNYATRQLGGYVDLDWFRMQTHQGPPALFSADERIEAERYDDIYLAHTAVCQDATYAKDQCVAATENRSSISFHQLDFKTGFSYLAVRVSADGKEGKLSVYLDNNLANPYCVITIPPTGGWQKYTTITVPVQPVTGKHRLSLQFSGNGGPVANINWFSFSNHAGLP